MAYVHGHAACVRSGCPMFGVNQAECCSGETAACGPLTAEVAAVRDPRAEKRADDTARVTRPTHKRVATWGTHSFADVSGGTLMNNRVDDALGFVRSDPHRMSSSFGRR